MSQAQQILVPTYDDVLYLLRDEFMTDRAAGSVNGTAAEPGPGTRTIVDTRVIADIASGDFRITGSVGGSADFDPGVWYLDRPIPRVFGQPVIFRRMLSTSGRWMHGVNNSAIVPPSDTSRWTPGIYSSTNLFIGVFGGSGAGDYTALLPIADEVEYDTAVVLRSTGNFVLAKGGAYPNWLLLMIFASGAVTPVYAFAGARSSDGTLEYIRVPSALVIISPLAYDTFTRADGALVSSETIGPDGQAIESKAWVGGGGWAIVSNAARNTPTPGSEQLADPGLEATYTAGLCNSLTKSGSPVLSQSADVHGGSKAQQFTATIQNDTIVYNAGYTPSAGTYVMASWWAKRSAGSGGTLVGRLRETAVNNRTVWDAIVSASYIQQFSVMRFTGVGQACVDVIDGGSSFDTGIVDDYSIKALTLSDLIIAVSVPSPDIIARVALTFPTNANGPLGLVLNLDSTSSPANFVLATIVKVSASNLLISLDKCVGGVYTTLISQSPVAYVAGAVLFVIKDGTSYSVFYNNAQISSAQTISNPGIIGNTLMGLFNSIGKDAVLDNFEVWARGTGGEYNLLGQT